VTAPVSVRHREALAEVVALLDALRRDVDLHARWVARAQPDEAVAALSALRHLAADLAIAADEFRLLASSHRSG
jgi:fumarate hydratase class II